MGLEYLPNLHILGVSCLGDLVFPAIFICKGIGRVKVMSITVNFESPHGYKLDFQWILVEKLCVTVA